MIPRIERETTIEDVAADAQVSVATVSRALRGLPNVAPATRDRVLESAARLQYEPNPSAARLAAGRTQTVGMVVPVLTSWYFGQVMSGAEAVLDDAGYDLLITGLPTTETFGLALTRRLARRVDGLIVVDVDLTPVDLERIHRSDTVVVTIGYEVDGLASVAVDDVDVAKVATRHLLDLGHRRIGLLAGVPDDPFGFAVPRQRQEGYRAALDEAGIDLAPEYEVAGNFTVDGGADATRQLLALPEPPTAIFAMADEMAFGAFGALRDAGLSVPDDMSIVGVDDHDVSEVMGLTTVQQQVAGHGATAARMLLDLFADPDTAPEHRRAATRLIERSSTARLPR